MDDTQNITPNPDFSDIPALGDTNGLEAYLNNEALKAQGLPVQPTTVAAPASDPAQPAAPAPAPAPAPAQPSPVVTTTTTTGDSITLSREQLNAILASRGQAPLPIQPAASAQKPASAPGKVTYSPQEQQFIAKALAQGYSLEQINNFLVKQNSTRTDPALEQRIAEIEQFLKSQEYKTAETEFINKLSAFGEKWGLSEQDLVTFGNEALKQGINIAIGNVNLETVFRAVYPDQYAIRSRRMTPTTSSQIYGGTSIPEGSRANASKLEDAYVDSFLKGAMPNQYAALNKK